MNTLLQSTGAVSVAHTHGEDASAGADTAPAPRGDTRFDRASRGSQAYARALRLKAEHDFVAAAECFEWAADRCPAVAPFCRYQLGRLHERGAGVAVDLALAASYYRQAAIAGHVQAMYRLGRAHAAGRGVCRNDWLAAGWLRLAAVRGCAPAQYHLGMLHLGGTERGRAPPEATRWLREAAEAGIAAAQYELAQLCEAGDGCRRDVRAAVQWYRRAADQGFWPAQFEIARLRDRIRAIWPQGLQLSSEWQQKAVDYGSLASTPPLRVEP